MIRTNNNRAREFVERRKRFNGSNTFGEGNDNFYIVYSYGYHHPLFVWDGSQWFENKTKVSITTSRHLSQLRPNTANIKKLKLREIKELLNRTI